MRIAVRLAASTPGGNHTLTLTLTNTGAVAGSEVAQLYLRFPDAASEPPLQLKGFQKVQLEPKQSRVVSFTLGGRDLSIFDATVHRWVEQRGEFVASVGGGLAALKQHVSFTN